MDDLPRRRVEGVRYLQRSVPVCLIRPERSPRITLAYLLVFEEAPSMVRLVIGEEDGQGVEMLANPLVLVPQLLVPLRP